MRRWPDFGVAAVVMMLSQAMETRLVTRRSLLAVACRDLQHQARANLAGLPAAKPCAKTPARELSAAQCRPANLKPAICTTNSLTPDTRSPFNPLVCWVQDKFFVISSVAVGLLINLSSQIVSPVLLSGCHQLPQHSFGPLAQQLARPLACPSESIPSPSRRTGGF